MNALDMTPYEQKLFPALGQVRLTNHNKAKGVGVPNALYFILFSCWSPPKRLCCYGVACKRLFAKHPSAILSIISSRFSVYSHPNSLRRLLPCNASLL